MNEPDSNRQLAVFDSLLEDLARSANDPKTHSKAFFGQVEQLVDAIIAPESMAVVARGPNDSLLLVHGDGGLSSDVEKLVGTGNSFNLQPKNDSIAVTSIQLFSSQWGWAITEIGKTEDAKSGDSASKVSSVHRQILSGVSEIVSEFLQTQQAANQIGEVNRIQQFSNQVHSSLDLQKTANNIANESRLLLNCDRVSVYSVDRGRSRLLAVSSVASIESRSELLRRQKKLVRLAAKVDQPIGSDKPPTKTALRRSMDDYRQKSGFPFLFGMALIGKGKNIGYLLAESTEEINRLEFAKGLSLVLPPASAALKNALLHDGIPFRNTLGSFGKASRWMGISKSMLMVGLLLLGLAALVFLKTDFKIRIQGELRPAVERVVFAPADGLVDSVNFRHTDKVQANETLLQLRSPELELALTKNIGEVDKLTQLLDSKNLALNQASSDPNTAASMIGGLTSEISDVEYQLKSLADERSYVEKQIGELTVVSPIDGVVLTRNVEELLANRPVKWGDPLLGIANEDGAWLLRFEVPERKIGYLLSAKTNEGAEEPQELEFFFESNPEARYVAKISEIGNSSQSNSELGPVVVVECIVPESSFLKRHGATVLADVNCGRRSIGFVWTRELIDSIRRKYVW